MDSVFQLICIKSVIYDSHQSLIIVQNLIFSEIRMGLETSKPNPLSFVQILDSLTPISIKYFSNC